MGGDGKVPSPPCVNLNHRLPPGVHSMSLRFSSLLVASVAALLAPACASLGGRSPERAGPGAAMGAIHVRYTAAFEALKEALEENDLPLARSTARQLRGRLGRELESAIPLSRARTRADDMAALTLSGEVPSRESVEAALLAVERFEDIIDGRARLAAVTLRIELRRRPGEELVEARLAGESSWAEPLVLRPFAASILIDRVHVDKEGFEVNWGETVVLEEGVELAMAARGTASIPLAELPIQVPVGAMATRMSVTLVCTGGELEEAGDRYPARKIVVREAERTDIAGWIPTGLVEPQRLVRLVEQGRGSTDVLLECAIRIAPSRRAEALDGLGRALQTLPAEAVRPVVPAIRWLMGVSGIDGFGRDERDWKHLLAERYDRRMAAGEIEGLPASR